MSEVEAEALTRRFVMMFGAVRPSAAVLLMLKFDFYSDGLVVQGTQDQV